MNQRFSDSSCLRRIVWSHTLPHSPRGLSLAREKGWLLAWDDHCWLYLFNQKGDLQGQKRLPGQITDASAADDGSAYAAVCTSGDLFWLAPDLSTRWQIKIKETPIAAALDPYGQYLALADQQNQLRVLNRLHETVFRVETPRPFHHLTYVPAAPLLIGAADFGFVAAFDPTGKLAWRDGLVAHMGSLSVSGDGQQIILACFTDGLQRFSLHGKKLDRLGVQNPCRRAAVSFEGRQILCLSTAQQFEFLDIDGRCLGLHAFEQIVADFVLSPIGDAVCVALDNRDILEVELRIPETV